MVPLRRLIVAGFVWVSLVWGSAPSIGQALENRITVVRPAPGQTVQIQAEAGQVYDLIFDPGQAFISLQGQNLILGFDDDRDGVTDSRIEFLDLATLATGDNPPVFTVAGIVIRTVAVVNQVLPFEGTGEDGLPEVYSEDRSCLGGCGGGPLGIDSLRVTGRDLLFPDKEERSGHPLYSYLLFAGAREGTREERARFHSAIKAFVGQFSPAEVLENRGAARSEINIFYAPITRVTSYITLPSPSTYFFGLSEDKQVAVLQEFYDHDRAEVLIGRMRLTGNGPFIVSVLRPLSEHPVRESEAFLVQDLSGVPPDLVALWVDEFKRQVVREATGSPEHLRRLALNLRTQIAILAEAFSITRSAVAEMFEAPEEPQGGGN